MVRALLHLVDSRRHTATPRIGSSHLKYMESIVTAALFQLVLWREIPHSPRESPLRLVLVFWSCCSDKTFRQKQQKGVELALRSYVQSIVLEKGCSHRTQNQEWRAISEPVLRSHFLLYTESLT